MSIISLHSNTCYKQRIKLSIMVTNIKHILFFAVALSLICGVKATQDEAVNINTLNTTANTVFLLRSSFYDKNLYDNTHG